MNLSVSKRAPAGLHKVDLWFRLFLDPVRK
jgi:hypothetical protein